METGAVSEKIKRGKHTTRHSELIHIGEDTYLMDTPGFSSLFLENIEKKTWNIISQNLNLTKIPAALMDAVISMNQDVK